MGHRLVVLSACGLLFGCGSDADTPTFSEPATYPGIRGVAVSGNHVYTADDRLHVSELSGDTELIAIGAAVTIAGNIQRMAVRGNALYYRDDAGVAVADISDPTTIVPVTVLTGDFDDRAFSQLMAGNERFVASGNTPRSLITVWDLADPLAPKPYASIPFTSAYESIAISGNVLLVGEGSDPNQPKGYVEVWDISNPSAPQKGALASGNGQPGLLFRFDNGLLYCGRAGAGVVGPTVLDVRDPAHPTFVDTDLWKAVELFAHGGTSYLFAAIPYSQGLGGNYVQPYDTSDPFQPVAFGRAGNGSKDLLPLWDNIGSIVADDHHLFSVHSGGLSIVGLHL